eukprot:m.19176 g.19176  ORF g.19176 m.19176 type:complete len:81 (-) comp7990_c0_seq1:83-325(-)
MWRNLCCVTLTKACSVFLKTYLFIQRCYISDTLILPHDVDLFVSGVCCVYAVNHFPLSLSHPLFVVCKQTYEVSGLENAE